MKMIYIRIYKKEKPIFYCGLHDYEANDALGAPYTDKPFFPRNFTPPNLRPPVPEVRRFYNSGNKLYLTEGIEFLIYYKFRQNNLSSPEEYIKNLYRRHMRDDAAFTNKAGSNTRHSFVLGTNKDKSLMEFFGIVCPGGNIFRGSGGQKKIIRGKPYIPLWTLDYSWLDKNLNSQNALQFAIDLPFWLSPYAWVVYPEKVGNPTPEAPNGIFKVGKWDGGFQTPLMSSIGRQAVVDGIHCRESYFQENRLKLMP